MKYSIIKVTILITIITILSKFVGFVREALIALYFGANAQTDAYFLAQNMPSLVFPSVCTAISIAFITTYTGKLTCETEETADNYSVSVIFSMLFLSGILASLGYFAAPLLVRIFAPGFARGTLELAIRLTRITMPTFVLIMTQYILTAVLNAKKYFIGSQLAGLALNITIIVITIIIGSTYGVFGLTVTVVVGNLVQITVLLLCVKNHIKIKCPRNVIANTIDLLSLAVPIFLGICVIQINHIADKIIASGLIQGSLSALSYSNVLNQFVVSIIIVGLTTVLYPFIAEKIAINETDTLVLHISNALNTLIIVLTPITIITIIYSYDIVTIVFGRGEFDQMAVGLTSEALLFYSIGYLSIGIREVLIRVFYAYKDTKTPMINSFLSVFLNITLSIVLSRYMGVSGIALGTSIATILAGGMFAFEVKRKLPNIPMQRIKKVCSKVLISCGGMILIILLMKVLNISVLLRFSLAAIVGMGIYALSLYLLKCEEIYIVADLLRNYIVKKKAIDEL